MVRRLFDVVLSSLILIIILPLFILIAVMIRLDSPGPALFRHVRVGINRRNGSVPNYSSANKRTKNQFGKPFILYKFRTMYDDARARFPELYEYNFSEDQLNILPMKVLMGTQPGKISNGTEFNLGGDPRLTKMGRWLRRTSLDELPNFINVLRGDMSLIGPRPDISKNVYNYMPQHLKKFQIKPGITGLAQVRGRGLNSFHQTNELDIRYIESRSLLLDIKILLETVWISVKGEGAY